MISEIFTVSLLIYSESKRCCQVQKEKFTGGGVCLGVEFKQYKQ